MTNSAQPRRSGNEGGFILALSVLLVLVLSISGMSFLHLDFLERRTTRNTLDNHSAFYLANAGVERAREVLKIPVSGSTFSWTTVLNGTAPGYSTDPAPDPLLCPFAALRGCAILPFGAVVASPDNLVFGSTFDDGQYTVRAFNDSAQGEVGKTDLNQILIIRALGLVRGDQKLLEANVLAVSNLNLINCDDDGQGCPQKTGGSCADNSCLDAAPGREPISGLSGSLLPKLDSPLTGIVNGKNSQNNYYRKTAGGVNPSPANPPVNFPGLTVRTSIPGSGAVQSNSYYFVTGNVTIKNTTATNVVIFSTGTVSLGSGTNLTNTIVLGGTGVALSGNGSVSAPINSSTFLSNPSLSAANYPVIVTAGNVTGGSGSKTLTGTIFSARPADSGVAGGTVDVNPITEHGVVIGNFVKIQSSSTFFTDDHSTDPNYLKYYAFMPGFVYPADQKTTVAVPGTWLELQ